jgi:hypothetical protein
VLQSGQTVADAELTLSVADRLGALAGAADISAVPVYPISLLGLEPPRPGTTAAGSRDDESLRLLASATGGRAVAGTNAPSAEVPALFREIASHYVVGYRLSGSPVPGRHRRLQARVNRSNAIVEPSDRLWLVAPDAGRVGARVLPPSTEALAGLIPRADEPLRLAVAAFAIPGMAGGRAERAQVPILLGLKLSDVADGALPDQEQFDVEVRVFDAEGRRQLDVQRRSVTVRRGPKTGPDTVDVLHVVSLRPGRYNLRASAYLARRGRSGSVYTDVDVPAFATAPMTVSGVIIGAGSAPTPLAEIGPPFQDVPMTTSRTFGRTDPVHAFLHVYWGGTRAARPVTVRARVLDQSSTTVWSRSDTLLPLAESSPRRAEYRMALPLADLTEGGYLLTIEVLPATGAPVARHVRFRVE